MTFHEVGVEVDDGDLDVLAVADALEVLEAESPELARIVRLRYFAGLAPDEVADQLGVSESTVFRQWRFARAWLLRRMGDEAG